MTAAVVALAAAAPLAANCTFPSFAQLTASPAGHDLSDFAIGDINRDGFDDIVSVSASQKRLAVYINDGHGSFAEGWSTFTFYGANTVVLGDWNNDQRLDIALSAVKNANDNCTVCGRFFLYTQKVDGLFQSGPTYSLPYTASVTKMAVADFNGDGNADIALAGPGAEGAPQNLEVVFGTGKVSFPTGTAHIVDGVISDLVAGDFSGADGKPDLALAVTGGTRTTNAVVVLRNEAGAFSDTAQTAKTVPATGANMQLATGFFNADAYPDLAVTLPGSTQISGNGAMLLLGTSGTTLTSGASFVASNYGAPTDIGAVDVTQDGKLDVVFAWGSTSFAILRGEGNGNFNFEATGGTSSWPVSGVDKSDFDHDGRPDLLFSDLANDQFVPMQNSCYWHYTALTVTKSAESTTVGQPLTLTATLSLYPYTPMPTSGVVAFYQNNVLLGTAPVNANGVATYTINDLKYGTYSFKAAFSAGAEPYGGSNATVSHFVDLPPFGAPLYVSATGNAATKAVTITWQPTQNAGTHDVLRRENGAWSVVGTTSNTTFTDTTVAPNAVYVYTVRSHHATSGEVSTNGNSDVATTVSTAISLDRLVRGSDIVELRSMVNGLRAAAGLPAATFTDPSLQGVRIKGVHVTELRAALAEARTFLGLPAVTYTQPSIASGIKVMLADVQQIKSAHY